MRPGTERLPKKELFVDHPAVYAGSLMLLIAGVVIWVWSPILGAYFYADDFMYLLGAQTPGLLRASLVPGGTDLIWVYRPLASFGYYWVTRSLFGLSPVAFHLTSLFVHMVNATLVAWLLSRFGCSRLAALFASLVYAAHTTHFHGLVTPATFQEVLATFFVFSALALYLRQEAAPAGNRWLPTLTVSCFGAALLSKESAFSFPFLLTWLEIVHASSSSPPSALWMRCRRTFLYYAIAGVYGIFLYVSGGLPGGEPYALRIDFSVFRRLRQYLWWALEPSLWGLSHESNLVILLFAALVVILWRHRQIWLGLGWFLISLLPILFLPKRMAPNYVMIGLLGLCLVVAVAIDRSLAVMSRLNSRLAPYIGVIVCSYILFVSGAKAKSYHEYELQAGWTGQTQRFAKCVASHVLSRYPAGPPAKTVIFRGFDGQEKWTIWDGAKLNVLYQEPGIRSLFVPDPSPGPNHPLFSWKGELPERDARVVIDRRDIAMSPCEISPAR